MYLYNRLASHAAYDICQYLPTYLYICIYKCIFVYLSTHLFISLFPYDVYINLSIYPYNLA